MKKALCLDKLSSYQLASVTKGFFSYRNFSLLQKLFSLTETFSVTETFFLSQKYVSLNETGTKICFQDGNLFSEGNIFYDRHFCLTETCFGEENFFFVTENFVLSRKVFLLLFCQKYPF